MRTLIALTTAALVLLPGSALWAQGVTGSIPTSSQPVPDSRAPVTSSAPVAPAGAETAGTQDAQSASGTNSASGSSAVPASGGVSASAPVGTGVSPLRTAPPGVSPAVAAEYEGRLMDLRRRISALRSELSVTRIGLQLRAEQLLEEPASGAMASVRFENQMGAGFRLARIVVTLDNQVVLSRSDDRDPIAGQREIPLYHGQIAPGEHTLVVNVEYVGTGFGLFPYARGYSVRQRSEHAFSVAPGNAIRLRALGYEAGSATTPMEQLPAMRFSSRQMSLRDAEAEGDGATETPATPAGTRGR